MPRNKVSYVAFEWVQELIDAAQEVLGSGPLKRALLSAGLDRLEDRLPSNRHDPKVTVEEFSRFNEAIQEQIGNYWAARNCLRRIGQALFPLAEQSEQSTLLNISRRSMALMPQKIRIRFILESLANALKESNPSMDAWVEQIDGKVAFVDRTCPICDQRESQKPICFLYEGAIQKAVYWATGRDLRVHEVECIAKGDPYCRIVVEDSLS